MEYPKINSLWKREDPRLPGSRGNGKIHSLIEGDYAKQEFAAIDKWRVEEKIDGTNIRIYFSINREVDAQSKHCSFGYVFDIKGRTSEAVIPNGLEDWIYNKRLEVGLGNLGLIKGILYGEGFGAGIQSGGIYRPDKAFILFDCYTNRWSTREELKTIAEALNLETPHDLGMMTRDDIISFVKSKPHGFYGDKKYIMEGIVARSEPLMRFNTISADPVMWKLKVKDFK